MADYFHAPSSHQDARAGGQGPRYVILHYTGTCTAREAADVYLGRTVVPGGRVSPHYMIDVDGRITQFVPESRRAWHAGVSFWRGCQDLNSASVGIELVNEGETGGYPPYAEAQMEALVGLCADILKRHKIEPRNVLGHSDVAPARRCDPGPALDWPWLARAGIGLWPIPESRDRDAAPALAGRMVEAFRDYGYDPQAGPSVILRAFRSRYHPGVLGCSEDVDTLETAARLSWLMRHNPPAGA